MYDEVLKKNEKVFSIAPMMDWTDRHCRFFHRLLTTRSLLYTEMVVADALIYGDVERHLKFDASEHPVALQLGGSDPTKLAEAARIGEQWGYDEINLNVGCPSDRVQSGTFGACLMLDPQLVGQMVGAVRGAVSVPVTVKCRIGVDEQDEEVALDAVAQSSFDNGCNALWVHARKAWLQGLSPKENRDIPPLNYERVFRLKDENRNQFIGLNGGLQSLSDGCEKLNQIDGIMLGRAAYQNPSLLLQVDRDVYGEANEPISMDAICEQMMDYTARHVENGGRVNHVTRHMIGLFQGRAGARRYRQILSMEACKPGANEQVIKQAFDVFKTAETEAA